MNTNSPLRTRPRPNTLLAAILTMALAAAVFIAGAGIAADPPPRIVTSIKPVHDLAAAVMGNTGVPHLLIPGTTSPHAFTLRPSDARKLSQADAVFWIGPDMETVLVRPLRSLAGEAYRTALSTAPGIRLRAVRDAGPDVEGHSEIHTETHTEGHTDRHTGAHDHGDHDMHIWLDTANAAAMARAMARVLTRLDPARALAYAANTDHLIHRIERLEGELDRALRPLAGVPYMVFHDAYQYLESRYGLTPVAAVTARPDLRPGAGRIRHLRQRIKSTKVRCLFIEPQFPRRLIQAVTGGLTVRTAVLDPLGATIAPGPKAYLALMRSLAATLRKCLTPEFHQ